MTNDFHEVQKQYWEKQKHVARRSPNHPVIRAFVEPKIAHIRSQIDLPEHPAILDVGAGNGYFSAWWHTIADVTAVDYSGVILAGNPVAKKHVMDARALEFADNAFDLSFCNAVLHHIERNDRVQVIREMARVSKKYVAIIEPNRLNPFMAALSIAKKEERGGLDFSQRYCRSLLEQAGLRVIDAVTWGALTPNRMPLAELLLPLFRMLERPLPFGSVHIVVGEK